MDFYLFQQINPLKDFLSFLVSLDINTFGWINNLAGQFPWLDAAGVFFAKYLSFFLIASVFLIFWRKRFLIFQSFSAAILARFGIVELIRFLWERPRPFVENHVHLLLDKVNQAAFPSGHAAFFFALSSIIFLYNKKTGSFFFLASFLICLARVFCGIHWPLDILAGMLIGIFSAWLIRKTFRKF